MINTKIYTVLLILEKFLIILLCVKCRVFGVHMTNRVKCNEWIGPLVYYRHMGQSDSSCGPSGQSQYITLWPKHGILPIPVRTKMKICLPKKTATVIIILLLQRVSPKLLQQKQRHCCVCSLRTHKYLLLAVGVLKHPSLPVLCSTGSVLEKKREKKLLKQRKKNDFLSLTCWFTVLAETEYLEHEAHSSSLISFQKKDFCQLSPQSVSTELLTNGMNSTHLKCL